MAQYYGYGIWPNIMGMAYGPHVAVHLVQKVWLWLLCNCSWLPSGLGFSWGSALEPNMVPVVSLGTLYH